MVINTHFILVIRNTNAIDWIWNFSCLYFSSAFSYIWVCAFLPVRIREIWRPRLKASLKRIRVCISGNPGSHVSISALDLNLLVKACQNIESLTLDALEMVTADSQSTMDLISQTLQTFCAKSIGVDKIVLEANNLETLRSLLSGFLRYDGFFTLLL